MRLLRYWNGTRNSTGLGHLWRSRRERLFEPVDIASLVYFRVVFGGLMVLELARYWAGGHASQLWMEPEFHFKYLGFEWVQPLPGGWMHLLFAGVLLSALGMMLGFCYRACAALLAIGFTWLFLIDQANYLNHFYLICLLGAVSILLPANRRLALDCLRKPALRSDVAPAWTLWLLRAQMAIVYFYGGLAKLNADWFRGEPARSWLEQRADSFVFHGWWSTEQAAALITFGGLGFDLLIVPLLLWRKTRLGAFILAAGFHLTNSRLFNIGVFPWLAIALTALFFRPDWPRLWLARMEKLWFGRSQFGRHLRTNVDQLGFRRRGWIQAFLGVYLSWQLLMPLRHFLYPGPASWTEEGHRFAWHMMLRSKTSQTQFIVLDLSTTEVWSLEAKSYLTPRQYDKMSGRPDMILQFAHHVAGLMREKGRTNVHVHVLARVGLNGREPALLIDPDVNLAAVPRSLGPASWILPLGNLRTTPAWLLETTPDSAASAVRSEP